jgi:hypothetical protein
VYKSALTASGTVISSIHEESVHNDANVARIIFFIKFLSSNYYHSPSYSSKSSLLAHRIPSVRVSIISTSGDLYNFCIIIKKSESATPSDRLGYIQRKCGADFCSSEQGLAKTLS